jgi:CubicO group peptidase (beta-lactamase class C family)
MKRNRKRPFSSEWTTLILLRIIREETMIVPKKFSRQIPKILVLALSVFFVALQLIQAAELPTAKPEEVGLSPGRLERLGKVMQEYLDQGKTTGLVALIARDNRVAYLKAFGRIEPSQGTPMPTDAVFRIASQTKAVTSVAIMVLQEEGRLLIDDPVSKYIPEFAKTRVAVPSEDKKTKSYAVVPAKRQITIRDLLTHTAGISYGYGPAKEEYAAAGLQGWFLADKTVPVGEVIKKLAALPFDAQPGEKYVYGYNTDVLGYVVERASGMSLADFIADRITRPLGMEDTHFFLPFEKIGRFTPVYGADQSGKLRLIEDPKESFYVKGPRLCYAGGAGLLSTVEDYARFLLMLLNDGEFQGARVLSPKSVELMTVNHIGSLNPPDGFGLGFWVTEKLGLTGQLGSVGSFGWGGAYYTTYWVDPAERMVTLFMTQLLPAGNIDLQAKFKAMVYQSIIQSYDKR